MILPVLLHGLLSAFNSSCFFWFPKEYFWENQIISGWCISNNLADLLPVVWLGCKLVAGDYSPFLQIQTWPGQQYLRDLDTDCREGFHKFNLIYVEFPTQIF